jgi:hypothetical protein
MSETASALPRFLQRLSSGLAVGAMAAALNGCGDPEPLRFVVHFTIRADEKLPVAGAQVLVRGKNLGATDATGELKVRLKGFEGDRLPITLQCPSGYAANPAENTLILRSIQGLGGEERKPVTMDMGCQPTKRDAVVLVHAGGAATSLPIKIDGAVVGQTDALGFAHLHLRSDPGSNFEVSLDTSSNEKLMPQNPKQSFAVAGRDEVFVFEKSFKLPPAPKKPRKAKPKPPPRPVRLN